MRDRLLYLSGAITGIPEKEAYEWREKVEDIFKQLKCENVNIFNPVEHFSEMTVKLGIATDEDVMNVELYKLRHSDLVIYNCHYPKSLGSMAELAIAYERGIPILAFNENNEEIHPWIKCMCTKIFPRLGDLIAYYVAHYMYDD